MEILCIQQCLMFHKTSPSECAVYSGVTKDGRKIRTLNMFTNFAIKLLNHL